MTITQASGKTSFVNVLGSDQWSEEVVPTVAFNLRKGESRRRVYGAIPRLTPAATVRRGNITLKVWDVAGMSLYCDVVSVLLY